MGLIQKAFSDIITFSRSSNATRIGPNGLVQYAPHNLFTYSEDFSNAAWAKTACTVTTNAIASPNGTVTADLIQLGAGTTSKNLVATVTTTSPCTMTVYAKAGSHSVLQLLNSGTANHFCNFDLNSGVIGNSGSGTTGSIVSAGNGWYRCTATFNSTIGTGFWIVAADATGNGYNATTSSTGTYYIWGAQLSVGSVPGDYTPTTSAAVYGPRFDFDPVTLAARGLLIEEQRTNLLTNSEQFDNWTKTNETVTTNSYAAPDGTLTADTVTSNSATDAYTIQNVSGLSAGATVSFSIFIKRTNNDWVMVAVSRASATTYGEFGAWFNLSTGAVGSTFGAGTNTLVSKSITPVGNGWYRCNVVGSVPNATAYSPYTSVRSADGATGSVLNGSRALWGAQLEAGSFATSYIPTVASTVTRSADVASVNTLSPWFNATEGTLFADVQSLNPSGAIEAFQIDGGTDSNRIVAISRNSGSTGNIGIVDVSGSTVAALAGTSAVTNKVALAYKANDFAACVNGGAVATDTSGSVPTVTTMRFGTDALGSARSGLFKRLSYYPRRLTNAQLQALTA